VFWVFVWYTAPTPTVVCVTWLKSFMTDVIGKHPLCYDSEWFVRVTWLVDTVIWRIHKCVLFAWDSLIRVTWPVYMCGMTPSYVWHDALAFDTWSHTHTHTHKHAHIPCHTTHARVYVYVHVQTLYTYVHAQLTRACMYRRIHVHRVSIIVSIHMYIPVYSHMHTRMSVYIHIHQRIHRNI